MVVLFLADVIANLCSWRLLLYLFVCFQRISVKKTFYMNWHTGRVKNKKQIKFVTNLFIACDLSVVLCRFTMYFYCSYINMFCCYFYKPNEREFCELSRSTPVLIRAFKKLKISNSFNVKFTVITNKRPASNESPQSRSQNLKCAPAGF